MWRFFGIALLLGAACTAQAEGRRVRLAGVSVSGGYWSGPAWGPGYYGWGPGLYGWGPGYMWGPAWYNLMWYSGWAHPGYWTGFAQGPGMGEVKLSADRDAMVYVDGAYAGSAGKLKSIWLEPGKYDVEIRDDGGRTWSRKIYVLSGKTLALKGEGK